MLHISRQFVEQWSEKYDKAIYRWTSVEREVRGWLATRPEPKYLNKRAFLLICWWKAGQMTNYVRSNPFRLVMRATHLASEVESNDRLKLRILLLLGGVDVPIASTILHFLQPDRFPIFGMHVRSSLKKAGKWHRSVDDESEAAWLEYVDVMRDLANNLGVGLRELDKALWTYDKWGVDTPLLLGAV